MLVHSDPPSWTTIQPESLVVLSQSIDLVCMASGDPPISFTWVLMGEETTRLNSDPTSGNLTRTITQVNQYGVYICITTNNLGTDAASIDIIQASKYIAFDLLKVMLYTCMQLEYYTPGCYYTNQSYIANYMVFLTLHCCHFNV